VVEVEQVTALLVLVAQAVVAMDQHLIQQPLEPQTQAVVLEAIAMVQQTGQTAALVSLSSKSHLRTMPHSHLV
jgi:hypothetical protein